MEELFCEAEHQTPHQLSLSGNVILFNCKRAPDVSDSGLTFSRFSFKREDNRFQEESSGAATVAGKRSSHVDIMKCQSALHVRRRAITPCVLVMKRSERKGSFRYSLFTLSDSNRLEPCLDFKVPYQIRGSVTILRGPTVLWSHAGNVFYMSPQDGEVRQTPIQISQGVVGELPLDGGKVFILGLGDPSDQSSHTEVVGCLLHNGQVFDGTTLMPHPYIGITRCILVLSAEKDAGDGDLLKSVVVAATSHQQLVYFENGIVKEICHLPFEQPENIQVVNTGRNGCLLVTSFHRGHACAVWKETFQIAACWSGVSSVHVDDFLGYGSDQMLLIFQDEGVTAQPLDRFLLTDLCGISYAHCQDHEAPKTSPPPENSLLTLQALESRLQSGLSVLQELQREVWVKQGVLQQAVRALADAVSEREPTLPQPEQEGLIALWDSDDESKQDASDDKTRNMPAVTSKPRVEKLWRRFAEDQMVVGVMLTTESSAPMASVRLSILTETGQSSTPAVTQTRSQVLWPPAPCSSSSSSSSFASVFPEPAAKRSRQNTDPNACRLAVTAATRLTPLLNSGCVKCCVMLHYVHSQDAGASVSSPIPVVLHCGQFVLDINSNLQTPLLKTPELKTDEAKEDLLSLMAVLDHWVFRIDSPDHSLGDVHGWIQKRWGCKRVEVSPQYLLVDSPGPTAVMLIHWQPITSFQGELSVHSSELRMLQFLDSLLSYIPTSCSIHSVKEEEGEEGRKSLGCEEAPEPSSVKGLQRCREEWRSDVEQSRKRMSPLVEVERYCRLTQRRTQVQLDVDQVALLETQTRLLN
ncbi:Fanconi anemia group B protein isoform X2 [Antennarius striatus]|uniref:Fanconi anemia group B protein isoform X2 n=1 Tax=Antennarius striatus TaxID=241820 RepID=UPI0035B454D1